MLISTFKVFVLSYPSACIFQPNLYEGDVKFSRAAWFKCSPAITFFLSLTNKHAKKARQVIFIIA